MKYGIWISTAFGFVATAAVVSAQSGGTMSKGMSDGKMDKMSMDKSYTGCLEKDAQSGAYSLAHVTMAGMMKDGMAKDGAAKDGMMMDKDMWLAVTSKDVDLSKHVGHKITVLGTGAMPMAMSKDMNKKPADKTMAKDKSMDMSSFTIKSVTMVSSTCQ
jgi:hypothetical protein